MLMMKALRTIYMNEHLQRIESDDPGENLPYDLNIGLLPDVEASAGPYEGKPDISIQVCLIFCDPGFPAVRAENHPENSEPPHPLEAV